MSKFIMVVDDSETIRKSLSFVLKTEGYDVVEASNGQEALDMMKNYSIGLFISDINMPEMDGISFVKNLKSDNTYKYTPVIMLTTESGMDKVQEGKKAGAKAWMIKPFNPDDLVTAVKKLFIA